MQENNNDVLTQRDKLTKLVEEKETVIADLQVKLKALAKNAEILKTSSEEVVQNLSAKYENLSEENKQEKEKTKLLEQKIKEYQEEKIKLNADINSLNEEIIKFSDIKTTYDELREKKISADQECEKAKLLNKYYQEQLREAKKKYQEILPVAK